MGLKQEQGARLVLLRGQESQAAFAPKIGVHKNTLGNWERGDRDIGAEALTRLAQLGWSPLWVLTGIEPMRLPPGILPDAATDTALVVAREDVDAMARQEQRTKQVADAVGALQTAPESQSQPLQPESLTMAIQLAAEALDGATLDPPDYSQLVQLIYDALVNGLPSAQVIAFARPAARGLGNRGQHDGKKSVDRTG